MNSTKARDSGGFPGLLYKATSATLLFQPKEPQKIEFVVESIPSLRKAKIFATAKSRAIKVAQRGQAILVSKPEFAKFEAYCLAVDVSVTVNAVASACPGKGRTESHRTDAFAIGLRGGARGTMLGYQELK